MAVKFFGTLCVLVVVIVLNKVRIGSAGFLQFPSLLSSGDHSPIYSVYSRHLSQPHFFSPPATTPLPKTITVTYNSKPSQGWGQPPQGWGQPSSPPQGWGQQNDNSQGWGRPESDSNGWGQPPSQQNDNSEGWGRPQNSQPQNSVPQFGFFQNTDLLRTLPIIPETKTDKSKKSKTGKKQPKTPAPSKDDAEVIENDDETPAPVAASSSSSSARIRNSQRNKVQGRSEKQRALNRTPKSRKNSNRGRGGFDSRPDPFQRQVNGGASAEDESTLDGPPAEDNDIPVDDAIQIDNEDEEPAEDDSGPDEDEPLPARPVSPPRRTRPRPPKKNRKNIVNPSSSSNSPIDAPSQDSLQDAIQILVRVAEQLQLQPQNNVGNRPQSTIPQSQFGGSSFGGRNNNNPQQQYGSPSSNNFKVSNQNQFQFQPSGGFNGRSVRNSGRRNAVEPEVEIIKALGSEL